MQTSEKHRVIHGLLHEVKVGVGLMYAVSCNLQTSDGLINGAECKMKKIEYRQGAELPAVLWVKFGDATIGRQWRAKYQHLYSVGVDKSWTPIFSVKRETTVLNGRVIWEKFPLRPSAATMIHACQGSSFENICIDMDVSASAAFAKNPSKAKPHLTHAHYVAASQATSLEGLQILTWNESLITVSKEVQAVLNHMQKE